MNLAEQIEVGMVQSRRIQLAQSRVINSCMHQFDQQPFGLHLTDRQSAKAKKLSDKQNGFRIPWLRIEAGGPHRQRTAGRFNPVVEAFAIGM